MKMGLINIIFGCRPFDKIKLIKGKRKDDINEKKVFEIRNVNHRAK